MDFGYNGAARTMRYSSHAAQNQRRSREVVDVENTNSGGSWRPGGIGYRESNEESSPRNRLNERRQFWERFYDNSFVRSDQNPTISIINNQTRFESSNSRRTSEDENIPTFVFSTNQPRQQRRTLLRSNNNNENSNLTVSETFLNGWNSNGNLSENRPETQEPLANFSPSFFSRPSAHQTLQRPFRPRLEIDSELRSEIVHETSDTTARLDRLFRRITDLRRENGRMTEVEQNVDFPLLREREQRTNSNQNRVDNNSVRRLISLMYGPQDERTDSESLVDRPLC